MQPIDVGLSFSGSSAAESALGPQNFTFGDIIAGAGKKTPAWLPLAIMGGLVIVAVVFIVSKFR